MSKENVDFMRQAFQAFESGDLTALAESLHPEIEWKAVEDPVVRTGFEGVLESLAGWFEVWDEVHMDLEELIDAGASVVAVVNMSGRHAGSESVVSERFFQVWTMRGEQIVAFREYKTRREAFDAIELPGKANVGLVRSIHEAWERGDYSSVERLDPEIEYMVADGPEPGAGKGLAGLGRAWGAWMSAWEDLRIEVDEYRVLDDERVLVLARKIGRGKQSGLEIDDMHAKGATICHVRGGKVTRMVLYYDREHAFADLGLTE